MTTGHIRAETQDLREGDRSERVTAVRSTLTLGALAILLVLVAAACGGKSASSPTSTATVAQHAAAPARAAAVRRPLSKRAYERKMQILGQKLAHQLSAIGARADSTPAADAVALEDAIPALKAVARTLETIVPPPRVRAEHEFLRRSVLEYANELRGPIARLRGGDLNGLGDIYSLPGARNMETASKKIQQMGYTIVRTGSLRPSRTPSRVTKSNGTSN